MSKRLSILAEHGEQIEWDWTKIPGQYDFFTTQSTFSMLSGGFSTGKTSVLVARVLALSLYIPGNLGFLARLDGKALRHSTLQTLDEMLDKTVVAQRNDQLGFIRFKREYGGSKLLYGDLKDINDLKNINLGFVAIDQAEEIEKEHWDYLAGRLRRKNFILDPKTNQRQYDVTASTPCIDGGTCFAIGKDEWCVKCQTALPPFSEKLVNGVRPWEVRTYPRFMFGACNPEGSSHWIYDRFSGLPGPGGTVSEGEPGHTGFSTTTYEALEAGYCDKDYVGNLEQVYGSVPHMYERYLLGVWVEAEGLVYPGWVREEHTIPSTAKRYDGSPLLPEELPMFEFIDHGFSNSPTAAGWVVIEKCECGCSNHNFWVIENYKIPSQTVAYHASQIKSRRETLNRPLLASYLDAQCFSRNQSGKRSPEKEDELYSIADLFLDNGIFVSPNQKTWDVGFERITELLSHDPDHVHPITGKQGAPHLYVLAHCREFIQEMETYKWKKVKPGQRASEEPVDKNDDLMDGLNGFVAGRPELGIEKLEPPDTTPEWKKSLEEELDELTESNLSHMAF